MSITSLLFLSSDIELTRHITVRSTVNPLKYMKHEKFHELLHTKFVFQLVYDLRMYKLDPKYNLFYERSCTKSKFLRK